MKKPIGPFSSQKFDSSEAILSYVEDLVKKKIGPKLKNVIREEYLTDDLYNLKVRWNICFKMSYLIAVSVQISPTTQGVAYYNMPPKDKSKKGWLRRLYESAATNDGHFLLPYMPQWMAADILGSISFLLKLLIHNRSLCLT